MQSITINNSSITENFSIAGYKDKESELTIDSRIPVMILTGFLGSGKSTILNRILKESKLKIGIILNEFGDVNLESEIVESNKDDTFELQNGCMCCVARNDFIAAILALKEKKKDLEYIIIEASGLSDPIPIIQTIIYGALSSYIRLDSIVCTVDSLNVQIEKEKFSSLAHQIDAADFAIITKSDVCSDEQKDLTTAIVKKINPRCKVIYSNTDSLEVLFEGGNISQDKNFDNTDAKARHDKASKLFYKTETPLDTVKFQKFLKNIPKEVIRAKGIINLDNTKFKVVFQYVCSRYQLSFNEWNEDKITALLFIGEKFDTEELRKRLDECRTATG